MTASTMVLFLLAISGTAVLCNGFPSTTTPNHGARHGTGCRSTRSVAAAAKSNTATTATTTTALPMMGLVDYFREQFLDSRDGDFVPLEQSEETAFGPGPIILMYAVPDSIDDEEFQEMIQDGMPRRVAREDNGGGVGGVVIRRISGMDENGLGGDILLDKSVGEALKMVMGGKKMISASGGATAKSNGKFVEQQVGPCPVLYFSGVSNTEMMDTYRIIANEIYQETNGVHWPACAKVVRPALQKSLRQVLSEISRDHADAMMMRRMEAEKMN